MTEEIMDHLFNIPQNKDRRRRLRRDQTLAEKILWSQLRNRRLNGYKFFRQFGVGPYILDFYCPAVQLAIELDGPDHLEVRQQKHDQKRTEYLEHFRIHVLRFWNEELFDNPNRVVGLIAETLERLSRPEEEERNGGI
jgi:very-short-patch-repair endonuclease